MQRKLRNLIKVSNSTQSEQELHMQQKVIEVEKGRRLSRECTLLALTVRSGAGDLFIQMSQK